MFELLWNLHWITRLFRNFDKDDDDDDNDDDVDDDKIIIGPILNAATEALEN